MQCMCIFPPHCLQTPEAGPTAGWCLYLSVSIVCICALSVLRARRHVQLYVIVLAVCAAIVICCLFVMLKSVLWLCVYMVYYYLLCVSIAYFLIAATCLWQLRSGSLGANFTLSSPFLASIQSSCSLVAYQDFRG